jgi:hypothetical protein
MRHEEAHSAATSHPSAAGEPGSPSEGGARKEFGVIALAALFIAHWRVVAAIVSASTIVGLAALFLLVPQYEFSTTIQIGSRPDGLPLEAEELVVAKLTRVHIPQALQDDTFAAARGGNFELPRINVGAGGKGQGIVFLTSRGPRAAKEYHSGLHQIVILLLQREHERLAEASRDAVEQQSLAIATQLARVEAETSDARLHAEALEKEHAGKLHELDAEVRLVQAQRQRLDDAAALLRQELAGRSEASQEAENRRAAMMRDATRPDAMMLMLLNAAQEHRRQLADLKERIEIAVPKEHDALERRLASLAIQRESQIRTYDLAREKFKQTMIVQEHVVAERKAASESIERRFKNGATTRTIGTAIQSPQPVGITKSVALVLCVLLGIVFAVLTVLGIELAATVGRALALRPSRRS